MDVDVRGGHQELVSARFDAEAGQWQAIYDLGARSQESGVSRPSASGDQPQREVRAEVIWERHARALAWIDALSLPAGSRVLEIGGGAGLMTVALAQRGFQVGAV
ncbi:MAG: hypothetical protein C4346_11355, partial [Chloroflexota bacterium]